MPEKVPDTPENMEVCKRFCGPCPTFKPNELQKVKPHALFCARGKSEKPKDQIDNKGCNCLDCGIFEKYGLKGGWYCIHSIKG
ncbi:MAG: DUF2769 domain-containing protein [Promethearchaeota archaeon]|jgi:hypothetical protein